MSLLKNTIAVRMQGFIPTCIVVTSRMALYQVSLLQEDIVLRPFTTLWHVIYKPELNFVCCSVDWAIYLTVDAALARMCLML